MREGYANAPDSSKYQERKKSPIERVRMCYTCLESDNNYRCVNWCVVVEREKSRGSGGCGVKRTLDFGHPIRPQGRILDYERV
jgi:hypothetical protein